MKEMNELSYEKQKEHADNKKIFFHILGCFLLCRKDLIHNKNIKIGKVAHIVVLKVILCMIGLFKMKMHT